MTERPDTVGRENPRVVIVGGGFGGLEAAKALAKADAEVVLFDRHNHHLFQPLLYQIATAALSPANIAAPIRKILAKQKNCEVIMSEVTEVDLENRTVTVTDQRYAYDYLVLAAGARTNYFGNDVWSEVAPGLKNISEAIDVRSRFLLAFEQAEIETDEEARRAALTFAIVGAGPTGVELAGAMAEISRQTLRADFRHIDTSTVRVILIDAVDRVLSTFTPELSDRAQRDLEQLGVEVVLSTRVVDVRPGLLVVDTPEGEERIEAANVFWAAGVRGVRLGGTLGVELDRGGRVIVGDDLTVGSIRPPGSSCPASLRARSKWAASWGRRSRPRCGRLLAEDQPRVGECSFTGTRDRWPRSGGTARSRTSMGYASAASSPSWRGPSSTCSS
jgi:NADH dehydrogenase